MKYTRKAFLQQLVGKGFDFLLRSALPAGDCGRKPDGSGPDAETESLYREAMGIGIDPATMDGSQLRQTLENINKDKE